MKIRSRLQITEHDQSHQLNIANALPSQKQVFDEIMECLYVQTGDIKNRSLAITVKVSQKHAAEKRNRLQTMEHNPPKQLNAANALSLKQAFDKLKYCR